MAIVKPIALSRYIPLSANIDYEVIINWQKLALILIFEICYRSAIAAKKW